MKYLYCILLSLFLLTFSAFSTEPLIVKPLWIHDGDTFKATVANKAVIDCRIWGIDAPELDQPWGKVAKTALMEFILKKNIRITKKSNSYSRIVITVENSGKDIALELLKMGLAWHSNLHAPNMREYAKAVEEAKKEKRGLWSDKAPVAPWIWRKRRQTQQYHSSLLQKENLNQQTGNDKD